MKTSSAKAKGRNLQNWLAEQLRAISGLGALDIASTPMGVTGPDITMSSEALEFFVAAFECKNHGKFSVYKHYAQAQEHAILLSKKSRSDTDYQPVLIIKQDRSKPLAIVDAEWLLRRLGP